nr:hypothetical protein PBJLOJBB_PBJLOJBB_00026 [synthetic construct]
MMGRVWAGRDKPGRAGIAGGRDDGVSHTRRGRGTEGQRGDTRACARLFISLVSNITSVSHTRPRFFQKKHSSHAPTSQVKRSMWASGRSTEPQRSARRTTRSTVPRRT